MSEAAPRLSVVVASQDAGPTIEACLRAIADDVRAAGIDAEILVVDASRDGSAERGAAVLPGARIVHRPPASLVPELWSAGVAAARGSAVALTTAHCVPAAGWTRALLAALADGYGAVGGAIDCAPAASLLDRAIYYTRYSAYLRPFPAADAADLPADNAAYDAAALRRFPAYVEGPFWEPFLHADMRREGIRLRVDPAAVVTYVHSHGIARFVAQRFAHGWHFGAMRARGESAALSLARAAAFPLIPFLLLARVARRVWTRPAHRLPFLCALPLVTLFLGTFAAGECSAAFVAALRGGRRE